MVAVSASPAQNTAVRHEIRRADPRAVPQKSAADNVVVAEEKQKTRQRPEPVAILKQINRLNPDGSYTYGYQGADGSYKVEVRYPTGEVKGKYGYIDDKGELIHITYGAAPGRGYNPVVPGVEVAPPTIRDETPADYDYEYYSGGRLDDPIVEPTEAPVEKPARKPARRTKTRVQTKTRPIPTFQEATRKRVQEKTVEVSGPVEPPKPAKTRPQIKAPGANKVAEPIQSSRPIHIQRPADLPKPAPTPTDYDYDYYSGDRVDEAIVEQKVAPKSQPTSRPAQPVSRPVQPQFSVPVQSHAQAPTPIGTQFSYNVPGSHSVTFNLPPTSFQPAPPQQAPVRAPAPPPARAQAPVHIPTPAPSPIRIAQPDFFRQPQPVQQQQARFLPVLNAQQVHPALSKLDLNTGSYSLSFSG